MSPSRCADHPLSRTVAHGWWSGVGSTPIEPVREFATLLDTSRRSCLLLRLRPLDFRDDGAGESDGIGGDDLYVYAQAANAHHQPTAIVAAICATV